MVVKLSQNEVSHGMAIDVVQVAVFAASGHGGEKETASAVGGHVRGVVDNAKARRDDA